MRALCSAALGGLPYWAIMSSSVFRDSLMRADPVSAQRQYYRETAFDYDGMHGFSEHYVGLGHATAYIRALNGSSVLDTGCGTGLAMRFIQQELPELRVHGNDPSEDLLEVAIQAHGIRAEQLDCVSSESLPYADDSFDVVFETGMLHHVPAPERVIGEMLRVAKRAVFISEPNYYGMGRVGARLAKVGLSRLGLLQSVNRRRRSGHDWYYTEGDGVAWDYSVFDALALIRSACRQVFVIPTAPDETLAQSFPLLFASHCLVAGFKVPLPGTAHRRD
jgi:ubiquinone/menaquinone biosynthesis C-methylase UbiE